LPANVYDAYKEYVDLRNVSLHSINISALPPPPPHKRQWLSISRSKLDLVQIHLSQGEKVIWIDLDTIIAHDFSCFYTLPNFVVAPGLWRPYFSVINKWMPVKGGPNVGTRRGWKNASFSQYAAYASKHFVYGDLWMADQDLVDAAVDVEAELYSQSLFAEYDVQHYFSVLHARNFPLYDLALDTDLCMGYQFVKGHTMPWLKYAAGIGLATVNGELYCSETCKKVGVLSFTWSSYQSMIHSPCSYFRNATTYAWFRRHVFRWGNSVMRHVAHMKLCNGRPGLSEQQLLHMEEQCVRESDVAEKRKA
jgi:hypothetical protein